VVATKWILLLVTSLFVLASAAEIQPPHATQGSPEMDALAEEVSQVMSAQMVMAAENHDMERLMNLAKLMSARTAQTYATRPGGRVLRKGAVSTFIVMIKREPRGLEGIGVQHHIHNPCHMDIVRCLEQHRSERTPGFSPDTKNERPRSPKGERALS
jgi:hypothetical protein